VSKWNGTGGGTSEGFKGFRNNNHDENSNPNNNGGFGSRSSSGFARNYSQFGFYSCTVIFSFQLEANAVDLVVVEDLDRVIMAILVVSIIQIF